MEEELIIFDTSIKEQPADKEYWAVYDAESGQLLGVYPGRTADQFSNKLKIDNELADAIRQGVTTLESCSVDLTSDELTILEVQSLIKIDDILHRVIQKQWTQATDFDVYLKYYRTSKSFAVSLSDKFFRDNKNTKHRIRWANDTEMTLLITEYNDPNVLYYTISLKIEDIIDKDKTFDNIDLPDRFCVYTKRIFKNYVIEVV